MRILILGASGFIGSQLVREAIARKDEVVGLSRSGYVKGFSGECLKWKFGEQLPDLVLRNGKFDCAMHLAHDFSGDFGAAQTIASTINCIDGLRKAGVKRQIFFSSCSAGRHAISLYGRTKFALEQLLVPWDDLVIVRPGLVLGDGGIYGRISKMARKLPIILLPEGGRGLVPVITIERLCTEVLELAHNLSTVHEVNLFEPQLRSLRRLVEDAASESGRHPTILPIPSGWMISLLKVAERMNIALPVNIDNLKGFLANQENSHQTSLLS